MAKKKEKTFEPMPDDLLALQDEYISVDAEISRLEERKKQLQDRMLELMQTHDLKKAENDRIRISYISPSKRKNFDKTRFQEEHGDMYAQYLVDVETKASIRVSIKTKE
jgi:hypothetical protein|nr:MAG TPA: hypothetical protein [Caudoviricetes sp.]